MFEKPNEREPTAFELSVGAITLLLLMYALYRCIRIMPRVANSVSASMSDTTSIPYRLTHPATTLTSMFIPARATTVNSSLARTTASVADGYLFRGTISYLFGFVPGLGEIYMLYNLISLARSSSGAISGNARLPSQEMLIERLQEENAQLRTQVAKQASEIETLRQIMDLRTRDDQRENVDYQHTQFCAKKTQ